MATPSSQSGHVQSLVKALRLLKLLSEHPSGLSLKNLAQQACYPPSTTHRLLSTLQQEGFVRFNAEHMHWSVGVQTFIVGNAFIKNRDLVQIARPMMVELMEITGETVNLAMRDQGNAIYLTQVESRQMMRAMASPGTGVPLHCSAVGKMMLATMPTKERTQVIRKYGLAKLTAKTITSMSALLQNLDLAQQRGYALDDEEHAVGLRCVAAPIYDELLQPIAALSVSGPLARLNDEKYHKLPEQLLDAATNITQAYGGQKRPQTLAGY